MNKNLLLLLSFGIMAICTTNAQDYYWSGKKKIPLTVDASRIIVKIDKSSTLISELNNLESVEKTERISHNSLMIVLQENQSELSEQLKSLVPNRIQTFFDDKGNSIMPTGEILFEPKKGVSIESINKICENQLTVLNEKYTDYTALVKDYDKIFDLANKLYESGLVEYCHPNFIGTLVLFQNDPLYLDQYYLNNTGQFGGTAGIDINAPQAWGITTGLTDIKVAVLDNGVSNHPDLNGRVLSGYTAGIPTGNW